METLLIILLAGFLIYELFEHVVIPLLGSLFNKGGKALHGPDSILGERGEVRDWQGREGHVFVNGELWKAVSEEPLAVGNKVVVHKRVGLTVIVALPDRPAEPLER